MMKKLNSQTVWARMAAGMIALCMVIVPAGTCAYAEEQDVQADDATQLYAEEPDVWEGHEPYDLTEPEEYPYDQPSPENNWHEPELKPGETYDCGDAGWNTSVYINKPGSYTLKGESTHVRVMIESTGVKLYLADGLNLNCGATAYVGSRTAAINIGLDNGESEGTVEIISKKNASSYLEGYMAPAIRKDDTKTKLVFSTEDPEHPGTIKAMGGKFSAGIGGVPYVAAESVSTGNMEFDSGNIEATGGEGGAAGIGGGGKGGVRGLTFNGGNIKAYGNWGAAAIGGGNGGDARDLVFNGGTVAAVCQNSGSVTSDPTESVPAGLQDDDPVGLQGDYSPAAIGSGSDSKIAENIIFNDGSIYANTNSGVSIGAGSEATLKNLVIRGGTIRAKNDSLTAAGIGAADGGDIESLTIEGGIIDAAGGPGAPAIGSKGDTLISQNINISISGGTIKAVGGRNNSWNSKYDIGSDNDHPKDSVKVTVTGGSILCDQIQNVKNDKGEALHKIEVGFENVSTDGLPMESVKVLNLPYEFGINQVCTNNQGKVYFWLPSLDYSAVTEAHVNGKTYSGFIKLLDSQGTLGFLRDNENEDYSLNAVVKLVNNGWYVARLVVEDGLYHTASCAIGQESEVVIPVSDYRREMYRIRFQVWNFGWQDYGIIYVMHFGPGEQSGLRYTCSGTIWDFEAGYDRFDPNVPDNGPVSATIKTSRKTVKSGRASTVKVTSDSGAKLTVKATNTKAKKQLKKKNVTITNGKTAKIKFTKKAPKGKYTFKVTSPATGGYKKTTKKITINVHA